MHSLPASYSKAAVQVLENVTPDVVKQTLMSFTSIVFNFALKVRNQLMAIAVMRFSVVIHASKGQWKNWVFWVGKFGNLVMIWCCLVVVLEKNEKLNNCSHLCFKLFFFFSFYWNIFCVVFLGCFQKWSWSEQLLAFLTYTPTEEVPSYKKLPICIYFTVLSKTGKSIFLPAEEITPSLATVCIFVAEVANITAALPP